MMIKPRDVTPQDMAIGIKIHEARIAAKVTQFELARKTNISRQQIQKYETGEDRVTAGRLSAIAKILETPVSFFFENIEWIIAYPLKQALVLQASQSFQKIRNPEIQKELLFLMEVMNSKEI